MYISATHGTWEQVLNLKPKYFCIIDKDQTLVEVGKVESVTDNLIKLKDEFYIRKFMFNIIEIKLQKPSYKLFVDKDVEDLIKTLESLNANNIKREKQTKSLIKRKENLMNKFRDNQSVVSSELAKLQEEFPEAFL